MNELKIFENPDFGKVRTMEIDGEPYFVGKDIAEILGYSNPNEAISEHIDFDDKLNSKTLSSFNLDLGQRGGWLINESGLYSLILSSKLPKAKEFKRWVTSEVLPSIRKHGLYATEELISNPDIAIAAFQALKEERERNRKLTDTIAVQNQQLAELQPKASYYDLVLNCKDLLSITEIAKDYGKSAKWLNNYLHENKVQYKQSNTWLLYQNYAEKGYTNTKTQTFNGNDGKVHTKVHTYWTQKGRLFIYDLLKSKGIVPIIERG